MLELMFHVGDVLPAGRKHALELDYLLREHCKVDKLLGRYGVHFRLRAVLQEGPELQLVLAVEQHSSRPLRVGLVLPYDLIEPARGLSKVLRREILGKTEVEGKQFA